MTIRVKTALAAAGVVAMIAGCGPSAPDPTTTGGAGTTTLPPIATGNHAAPSSPASTVDAFGWRRVNTAGLHLGGGATSTLATVLAPLAPGDPWLVAGTRTLPGGTTRATVWSSPDALVWTAATLPTAHRPAFSKAVFSSTTARAMAQWGQRTVVVGSTGRGAATRAAVWISPGPGRPFAAVDLQAAFVVPPGTPDVGAGGPMPTGDPGVGLAVASQGATIDTVTAGALGVFAAGSVAGTQALWYSSNGASWTRLTKAEAVIAKSQGAVVRQLLETPAGVFAAGSVRDATATDAAIWTSGDGLSWRRIEASSAPGFTGDGEHAITGLTTFGTSLVAVGGTDNAGGWSPMSWIAPGSFNWGPPSEAFPITPGPRAGATLPRSGGGAPSSPR